jgi:hypothetical protein
MLKRSELKKIKELLSEQIEASIEQQVVKNQATEAAVESFMHQKNIQTQRTINIAK